MATQKENDEHGPESPPIDGEDAMFWTPVCYCGDSWPHKESIYDGMESGEPWEEATWD